MSTEMKKIKRSEFATFMNTTPIGEAPTWTRMGTGITAQTVSYNPSVTTETYIHADNATTTVDSYAVSIDGSQTCYKGEPIFEYIDGLRKKRAVGADCETEILLVNIYDKQTDGSYSAEKSNATIQVSDFGGDAGAGVTISYTVSLNGDATHGTATITNGTVAFSEKTESN